MGSYGEIWGGMGRYGEIWGGRGRYGADGRARRLRARGACRPTARADHQPAVRLRPHGQQREREARRAGAEAEQLEGLPYRLGVVRRGVALPQRVEQEARAADRPARQRREPAEAREDVVPVEAEHRLHLKNTSPFKIFSR